MSEILDLSGMSNKERAHDLQTLYRVRNKIEQLHNQFSQVIEELNYSPAERNSPMHDEICTVVEAARLIDAGLDNITLAILRIVKRNSV